MPVAGWRQNVMTVLVGTFFWADATIAIPLRLPPFDTFCLGASNASSLIIFLQGITPANDPANDRPWHPTKLFFTNRVGGHLTPEWDNASLLDKIGKICGVQFAMPFSDVYCKGSHSDFCWGTEDPDSVAEVYDAVQRSAAACIPMHKEFGILGFSNGGYHVGRVITQGHLPLPRFAIAIGSAGDLKYVSMDSDGRKIPLYFYIGDADITRQKAEKFFTELKDLGFDVRFTAFSGGHELKEDVLIEILRTI